MPSFTEVEWQEGARQINECEYIFVHTVHEIEELTLELIIVEAKARAPILVPRGEGELEQLLVGGRPISSDATCRFFRLVFDRRNMVSYMVLNETYGRYPEPPEKFVGRLFRTFSRSALLEFTKRTTHACDEHPGPLQHYEIACLNHVVDVICTRPPRIAADHRGLMGAAIIN